MNDERGRSGNQRVVPNPPKVVVPNPPACFRPRRQRHDDAAHTDVVFFLGAGFTKAAVSGALLGADLIRKILDTCLDNDAGVRDLRDLRDFIFSTFYPIRGIWPEPSPRLEDILSILDYAAIRRQPLSRECDYERARELRNALVRTMTHVLESGLLAPPSDACVGLFRKIRRLIAEGNGVTVISTNYDCVADNQLLRALGSCNYGCVIRRNLQNSHQEADAVVRREPGAVDLSWSLGNRQGRINQGSVMLLKVHGSLNWLYCPKCDEIDVAITQTGIVRDIEQTFPPCSNPHCTESYEQLLVAPTMFKIYENRFLAETWELAEAAIRCAKAIVFIGYSIPEADYELRCMLTRAVANSVVRAPGGPVMVIIDDDPRRRPGERPDSWAERKRNISAVRMRYESLFGPRALFRHIGLIGLVNRFNQLVRVPLTAYKVIPQEMIDLGDHGVAT